MIEPSVFEYFQRTKEKQPIRVEKKNPNDIRHQALPEHLQFNNGYAKCCLDENPEIIKVSPPELLTAKLANVKICNELNPDPEDTKNPGEIDIQKVENFLNLSVSDDVDIDLPLFETIPLLPRNFKSNPQFRPPFPYDRTPNSCMVEITIKTISKANANVSYNGFFQIYYETQDSQKGKSLAPYSEPLYFSENQFTQSGTDKASFFCIDHKKYNYYLLCFIYTPLFTIQAPYCVAGKQLFVEVENNGKRSIQNFTTFDGFLKLDFEQNIRNIINSLLEPLDRTKLIAASINNDFLIHYLKPTDYEFTYTWLARSDLPLTAIPIDPPITSTAPVISIFDLDFTFKNPPDNKTLLYFKAFVIKDQLKNPTSPEATLPVLLFSDTSKNSDKSSSQKVTEVTSAAQNATNQLFFFENIRVLINDPFPSYLVIYIYQSNIVKQETMVPFKVGFIPLFSQLGVNDHEPQKIILYDPKRLPKDYLKHPKPPKNTYLTYKINIPPLYFPSPLGERFIQAYDSPQVDIPEGEKDLLKSMAIPIFSKILSNMTMENLKKCIEFFSKFDKKEVIKDMILPWIYNVYYPLKISPRILDDLTTTLTTFMDAMVKEMSFKDDSQAPNTGQRRDRLMSLTKANTNDILPVNAMKQNVSFKPLMAQLPMYTHVLIAAMNYTKDKVDERTLLTFIKAFAEFFVEAYKQGCSDEDSRDALEGVSVFLFHCMYRSEFSIVSECIFIVLRSIHLLRNSSNEVINSRFTFWFLLQFAYTPQFTIGLGTITKRLDVEKSFSPYNKLLSLFFLSILECLTISDNYAIRLCCMFLLMIAYHVEKITDESVAQHIAYVLFPIINTVFSDYDSLQMKSSNESDDINPPLYLIPFSLIILNKAPQQLLTSFYRNLATSFQQQFISKFLNGLYTTLAQAGLKKNLSYFIQMTKRLIKFLHVILPLLKNSFVQVVKLCDDLLNDYQSPSNYVYFYQFLSRAIIEFQCERTLIAILLKRVTSTLMSTRCLVTALLALQFQNDYKRNNSIVLSSIDTMDSLTAILLDRKAEEIDIFNKLIDIIVEVSKTQNDQTFISQVDERMKAAKIIADVVKDQKQSTYPVETRCQQIMMIADQYNMYPTMRVKWLQECLKINKEDDDYISAFVTQLHIVALMATVYYNNKPNIEFEKKADQFPFHLSVVQPIMFATKVDDNVEQSFSFMPEVVKETKINFSDMQAVALDLLTDITLEEIFKEINNAIDLGTKADLYYSLRPIESFQLRLYHRTRNFKECANCCKKLSESFAKITTNGATLTHDTPIQLYLVINNLKPEQKNKVYYVKRDVNDKKIIEILKSGLQSNGNVQVCPSIDPNFRGTCAIPLEIDCDIITDDEHPHCWRNFKTPVYISDYEHTDFTQKEVKIIKVVTSDHIPHYRKAVDVESISIEQYSVLEIIQQVIESLLHVIDVVTKDVEMWFENERNVDYSMNPSQFITKEISKLNTLLNVINKEGKEKILDKLKILQKKNKAEANQFASQIRTAMCKMMEVLRRCAIESNVSNDTAAMLDLTIHMKMHISLANKFCSEFDLQPIPVDAAENPFPYKSYQDPMSLTFDFEKQAPNIQ